MHKRGEGDIYSKFDGTILAHSMYITISIISYFLFSSICVVADCLQLTLTRKFKNGNYCQSCLIGFNGHWYVSLLSGNPLSENQYKHHTTKPRVATNLRH